MRYIDERIEGKKKAEVGDFIFATGELFVIYKTYRQGKNVYQALYVTGSDAFDGAGITEDSLEEVVDYFKRYDDFELIKSEEMKLVREKV